MNKNFLFAIDLKTKEIMVSESLKGSNQITLIERIKKEENEMLYHAVYTLTFITQSPDFESAIFKAMDKVCQMMYKKHKEKKQ